MIKKLERENIYYTPEEIEGIRKDLGLSIENFAYLTGVTRQSIYNWERRDRQKPQSRAMDLLMKLIRHSLEKEKVDVLAFLIHESQKLGIDIKVKRRESKRTRRMEVAR
ncbi:MAG TPA: helix-turn-helix domain-containing protein [Thermodesulfobacteriota bacterium]|nr:helix-turn-helix domain-containing protein [Thermodesulfobacteriota bacterium]